MLCVGKEWKVIELLENHLMSEMESANSRKKYRQIIEYLKVMAKFEGGLATARESQKSGRLFIREEAR